MSTKVSDNALRPSFSAALLLVGFLLLNTVFVLQGRALRAEQQEALPRLHIAVAALGLTDLVVATEARYTRHPAVSDPLTPFMSHPGAIEHFPTGSFWAPPPSLRQAHPSSARNRPAAPHLRAINQACVPGVRGAWLLARTCGTAERFRPVVSMVVGPGERLRTALLREGSP